MGGTARRFISAQILGTSSPNRIYGECRTSFKSDRLQSFRNFFGQMAYYKTRLRRMRTRSPLRRSTFSRKSRSDCLLTLREREVLEWLARGKSNSQIGAILGISAATVSKHLEHIYPKLGVENRTAA